MLSEALKKFLYGLGDQPKGIQDLGFNSGDIAGLVEGTIPQRRVLMLAPNLNEDVTPQRRNCQNCLRIHLRSSGNDSIHLNYRRLSAVFFYFISVLKKNAYIDWLYHVFRNLNTHSPNKGLARYLHVVCTLCHGTLF